MRVKVIVWDMDGDYIQPKKVKRFRSMETAGRYFEKMAAKGYDPEMTWE